MDSVTTSKVSKPIFRSTEPLRVMVIDDDAVGRDIMAATIEASGCIVSEAGVAEAMLQQLDSTLGLLPFDVVVMDVNLPGVDGMTAAQLVRRHSDAGIILVSVIYDGPSRSRAIDMGADDFLVKPLDMKELVSRVHRLGARVQRSVRVEGAAETIPWPDVELNLRTRELVNEKLQAAEPLTQGELLILKRLLQNQDSSREELLALTSSSGGIAGSKELVGTRSVDTLVARLRKKLQKVGVPAGAIRTVRGVGYTLSRSS